MGSAVRLLVEADDVHHPNGIDGLGEKVDLGADEIGIGQRFVPPQEKDLDRMIGGQLLVEAGLDLPPELDGDPLQLEIHPGRTGLHVASGHLGVEVAPDDRRERMESGMGAHQQVPARPVDLGLDRRSRRGGLTFDDVHRPASSPHGVGDSYLAARPPDHAGVARLAAAARVEDGPVEHQPFAHGFQHGGRSDGGVRIDGRQLIHHPSPTCLQPATYPASRSSRNHRARLGKAMAVRATGADPWRPPERREPTASPGAVRRPATSDGCRPAPLR